MACNHVMVNSYNLLQKDVIEGLNKVVMSVLTYGVRPKL